MRENIHFTDLGATLFVPATHKNLSSIISGEKYPSLKSVVIDTEDGIEEDVLLEALQIIQKLLVHLKFSSSLLVFIRPRNEDILQELLKYENIEAVDGFILPKFSLQNADTYLEALKNSQHYFMPSIEGKELFDVDALKQLRDKLLVHQERILLVRFGLEDMLRQVSMQRSCEKSIFEYAVCNSVLGNFLAVFKSVGFGVSGGVYPYFSDAQGFKKDVLRDLQEGLFSKTIIHPSQIDVLHNLYKVSQREFDEARLLVENETSIINLGGKMGEAKTMNPYAKLILKRAKVYGIST